MLAFMNHLKAFYSTRPAPCPYLPDKNEAKTAVDLSGENARIWANVLSRAGFRRSHGVCYTPSCPDCRACVSVRVRVADFYPNKKMRKTLRQNETLKCRFLPNIALDSHYALFRRYLDTRHQNSEMRDMFFEEYRAMIEDTPVAAELMELSDENGVVGVMLIDETDDGLSAVYSFFDPDFSRNSPGTLMILRLIESAKDRNKPYVYLGYMIRGLSNMAYKEKFAPLEYCNRGKWSTSFPD